jgi:hypothetical protein
MHHALSKNKSFSIDFDFTGKCPHPRDKTATTRIDGNPAKKFHSLAASQE